MALHFLKVLPGTGHFGLLVAWWAKDGWGNGCGSSSFRRFTIVFISFLWWHVFVVAPAFSWF
jgi:hypothetical protein